MPSFRSFTLTAFSVSALLCLALLPRPAAAQLVLGNPDDSESAQATITDTGTSVTGYYSDDGDPFCDVSRFGGYNALYAYNGSALTLAGGQINNAFLFDGSMLEASGGSLRFALLFGGNATIDGGSVATLQELDGGLATLQSGSVQSVFVGRGSQADVYGGLSGAGEIDLSAGSGGTINLFGSGFTLRPSDPADGDFYYVSGTLQSGEAISDVVYQGDTSSLLFNSAPAFAAVPEASTTVSLGLLLVLGLGGVVIAAKRSKRQEKSPVERAS